MAVRFPPLSLLLSPVRTSKSTLNSATRVRVAGLVLLSLSMSPPWSLWTTSSRQWRLSFDRDIRTSVPHSSITVLSDWRSAPIMVTYRVLLCSAFHFVLVICLRFSGSGFQFFRNRFYCRDLSLSLRIISSRPSRILLPSTLLLIRSDCWYCGLDSWQGVRHSRWSGWCVNVID